jgi:hypothetical protein
MVTIRLYNDYGGAHYECNTPRSLKSVLTTAHKQQLQFEIIRGSDLAWVQQQIKNHRESIGEYEEAE